MILKRTVMSVSVRNKRWLAEPLTGMLVFWKESTEKQNLYMQYIDFL